jgi:hypothetical protein
VKLHQSIAVCLTLMAGVTADGCFAQSATDQTQSVAAGTASQDQAGAVSAVAIVPSASSGLTREQVQRELADFQNSEQAAKMRELYRGSN